MPYIEQDSLWWITNDQTVASTPIKLYFCPSRRAPIALSGGPWAVHNYPRAMTDYAGNAGTSPIGGDGGGIYGNGNDGVIIELGTTAFVNFAAITDGTSNTILIGEKHMNINFVTTECQPDDNDGYVGGFQDDVVRWGAFPPLRDASFDVYVWGNGPPPFIHPGIFQFGSSHPAGFQAVFCDGHVQVIRYDVDLIIFGHACCRNDGVAFDLDNL